MTISTSWHSYTSIYNVGHACLAQLFDDPIIVEEKVDGSQFSFGIFDGVLKCRSKGVELNIDSPEQMFLKAVNVVKSIADFLTPGWTYRAEYLSTPKHNTLCYDRTPTNHLMIFDINSAEEQYLSYDNKKREAERLGLECVPLLYAGGVLTYDEMKAFLDLTSVLGGAKIEGFVIKNYFKFGPSKKALMGKHVSEAFKEKHSADWGERNPTRDDIIELIGMSLRTDARWEKAVQHLRDEGRLENSPKDIGMLLKEVGADILKECEDEIKEKLWKFAWPKINRIIVRGFPEWYKDRLLKSACKT